jgi:hypothetical protein
VFTRPAFRLTTVGIAVGWAASLSTPARNDAELAAALTKPHPTKALTNTSPKRHPRETSPMPVEPTTSEHTVRSRGFIAAVVAIGGMQLMATMDGMIAVVALPKIQTSWACLTPGEAG